MSCGGLYSELFSQCPRGSIFLRWGALIQLCSRMEDRYLSLDRYPFVDLLVAKVVALCP